MNDKHEEDTTYVSSFLIPASYVVKSSRNKSKTRRLTEVSSSNLVESNLLDGKTNLSNINNKKKQLRFHGGAVSDAILAFLLRCEEEINCQREAENFSGKHKASG